MMRRTVICSPFALVVVPFPFTDQAVAKKRPALVLSSAAFNRQGHTILAMVTSKGHSPWPGDTPIRDLAGAGLPAPSLVRLKLFTLDNRLLLRQLGSLGAGDAAAVTAVLAAHLPGPSTP